MQAVAIKLCFKNLQHSSYLNTNVLNTTCIDYILDISYKQCIPPLNMFLLNLINIYVFIVNWYSRY